MTLGVLFKCLQFISYMKLILCHQTPELSNHTQSLNSERFKRIQLQNFSKPEWKANYQNHPA